MVKKDKTPQPEPTPKPKPPKQAKTRNKQMFTQLKTHEQTKISKFHNKNSLHAGTSEPMINEEDQNSYDNNQEVLLSKDNQDIQQLCTVVHHLIEKKKLNVKNAFQVPFIDLEKLDDFRNIVQSENGWKRISSTLQNDSKIYSLRVDAIHSIAYKIMNTMTRNQDEAPPQTEPIKQNIKQSEIDKVAIPMVEEFDIELRLHLEKNTQNINMQQLDKLSQFNPMFERTRRKFDQNGLKGMLLNNIQLDSNLQLCLNQTRKVKSSGLYLKPTPVQVRKFGEQPEIFRNVENTRKSASDLVKQEFSPSTGYEQSWKKIMNGEFNFQKDEIQNNSHEMDIEVNEEKSEPTVFKKVQDVIKLKSKTKLSLKNPNDVAQDGLSWLSEMDKKILGISTPCINPVLKKSASVKIQRNEDDIQFSAQKVLQKKQVFSQQTMQKQKQEYNEEVQQKHLLPLRLFHRFKVEQIMTLREEPKEILMHSNMEIEEVMQEREVEQVDIRRQQMSIRESKQKLKSMVLKQIDFKTLCRKFEIDERNIPPELCFLTVLHLANQNNLRLEQMGDFNFKIKS